MSFYGESFGVEGIELVDELNLKTSNQDSKIPKLDVLMSPELLTHMRKILVRDKKAIASLRGLKGTRIQDQDKTKDKTKDKTILPKDPSDYPMPPSPESNSPSDSSDKGKYFLKI